MEMTDQIRNFVRSLNASALTPAQVDALLEIMLQLDPECGPVPLTAHGKVTAASTFVRLMQGDPVQSATGIAGTWRTGHAR